MKDRKKPVVVEAELYDGSKASIAKVARLGKMAKQGGPGYLAKKIWDCASARPSGSWLDYIQGMLRKRKVEEPDMGTRLKEF